jgi:hypothetical protein
MTYLLLHRGAALYTTAIARMHGKAVKLRHCPATVSAPAPVPVVGSSDDGRFSARAVSPSAEGPRKPLEANLWGFVFGKVAGEGVSQETGPRRF